MTPDSTNDDFYRTAPTFRDFRLVADEFSFSPLPEDWLIGVADVEQSTKAIHDKRYKAVNMAGAAVIAAIANAIGGREFPFVFGGDGASFAVSPADAGIARQALAETATWVREDLDLTLRVGWYPSERSGGTATTSLSDGTPFRTISASQCSRVAVLHGRMRDET